MTNCKHEFRCFCRIIVMKLIKSTIKSRNRTPPVIALHPIQRWNFLTVRASLVWSWKLNYKSEWQTMFKIVANLKNKSLWIHKVPFFCCNLCRGFFGRLGFILESLPLLWSYHRYHLLNQQCTAVLMFLLTLFGPSHYPDPTSINFITMNKRRF